MTPILPRRHRLQVETATFCRGKKEKTRANTTDLLKSTHTVGDFVHDVAAAAPPAAAAAAADPPLAAPEAAAVAPLLTESDSWGLSPRVKESFFGPTFAGHRRCITNLAYAQHAKSGKSSWGGRD